MVVGIVTLWLSQRGSSLRQGYEDAISRQLDDVLGAGYGYKYSFLAVGSIAFVSWSGDLSHALLETEIKMGKAFLGPARLSKLAGKNQHKDLFCILHVLYLLH